MCAVARSSPPGQICVRLRFAVRLWIGEVPRAQSTATIANGGMLAPDSVDDIGRDRGGTSRPHRGPRLRRLAALCERFCALAEQRRHTPRELAQDFGAF